MGHIRIGVISDTHGLLRPEALAFLDGCDRILHGGDIGGPDILQRLTALAPLTVVRGNNDTASWAADLPLSTCIAVGAVRIYLVHDHADVDFVPKQQGMDVVVSGHSHRPKVEEIDGTLWVNPGSAGPRRFSLPVCVAELIVDGGSVLARIEELVVAKAPARRR